MENIENYLLKLSFKSNDILTPDYECGVEPYIEWVKWLSYIPKFEKTMIEDLKSKKACDLTIDELKELIKYKEHEKILELFKIYGTDDIKEEEYMEVYNYMKDNSIEDLMISKLSKEELEYVKNQIEYYNNISDNELDKKIKDELQEENYKNLSMPDSYILHIISNINFKRGLEDLNKKIREKIKENDNKQYRSLQYASRFVCK